MFCFLLLIGNDQVHVILKGIVRGLISLYTVPTVWLEQDIHVSIIHLHVYVCWLRELIFNTVFPINVLLSLIDWKCKLKQKYNSSQRFVIQVLWL